MRAYILRSPAAVETSPLARVELPTPEPGPRQLRVRIHACAACRTDLHVIEGELAPRRPEITLGHQVVGVVDAVGADVDPSLLGQRVGVAWLHATCGRCRFCRLRAENLCERATFTGYTEPGGFAEQMLAYAEFVYPLPQRLSDEQVAPLLCAGIIGYRALRRTELTSWAGARLGIYGFGAAGHIAIQLARARGAEVHVATREAVHRELARELGAVWVVGLRPHTRRGRHCAEQTQRLRGLPAALGSACTSCAPATDQRVAPACMYTFDWRLSRPARGVLSPLVVASGPARLWRTRSGRCTSTRNERY